MPGKRFNRFERDSANGRVIARPLNESTDDVVPLPEAIAEREEDEPRGNWEEVVGHLTSHELGNAMTIDDEGRGTISRERAVEALVDAEDPIVRGELSAHAVIEYLAEEEIFDLANDGDEVVVLKPFDDILDGNPNALNNWAATLDTAVSRIEAARERVESAQERLEEHNQQTTSPADTRSNIDEQKEEIKQEIKSLLGGRRPDDLNDEEYRQFEQLRKRYEIRKSMEDVVGSDLTDQTDKVQRLGSLMQDLELVSEVMADLSGDFRQMALAESLFPGNAVEQLDNFVHMVTVLTDSIAPEDQRANKSDEEFLEEAFGEADQFSEAAESASEVSKADGNMIEASGQR